MANETPATTAAPTSTAAPATTPAPVVAPTQTAPAPAPTAAASTAKAVVVAAAATATAGARITLNQFALETSSKDKRVALLHGFVFEETVARHFKDTQANFEARFALFANKPTRSNKPSRTNKPPRTTR